MHPIRKPFNAGVIATVNTDDALVFGRGASEDFEPVQAKLSDAEWERIPGSMDRFAALTRALIAPWGQGGHFAPADTSLVPQPAVELSRYRKFPCRAINIAARLQTGGAQCEVPLAQTGKSR